MNHPTFNAELTPQELENLRKLSAQLGYTLINGPRAGDGSPRRLLQALAASVKALGVKRTAEAIRPILPTEKPA